MADRQIPLNQELANFFKREMGLEAVEKHIQLSDVLDKNIKRYEAEYGYDSAKWPKGVRDRMMEENKGLTKTLMPAHLQDANETLTDIESANETYENIDQLLRKQYPDLVARMERGEVKRIEEPRAPVPQPQMPTPAPVKTREPPRPAMPAPMQKPAEVKQPKTTVITGPSSLRQRERQLTPFEKAVTAQRDKWEKEGLFTPPPMQDIAKQRLLQMHDKEEEEVPVSLPEAVNPTAR